MKLDTSTYYPKSHLEEEDVDVWIDTDTKEEAKPIPNPNPNLVPNSEDDQSQFLDDDGTPETPITKAIDKICTLISWILVPILMPIYGMLLAYNYSILYFMPYNSKVVFLLIALGFTVIIPMLLVYLLKKMGIVSDLGLNGRKERFIPYIISILSLAGTGWFMIHKGAPLWFGFFFIGGAAAGLINLIINFKWKISAHSAGIAGIVALMIRIISIGFPQPGAQTWLIISIIAAGILGSVRIWQGRHTLGQVIGGYAVGFLSVLLFTLI